eukprot:1159491-Pelagomonas_calceolata.AAC.27
MASWRLVGLLAGTQHNIQRITLHSITCSAYHAAAQYAVHACGASKDAPFPIRDGAAKEQSFNARN